MDRGISSVWLQNFRDFVQTYMIHSLAHRHQVLSPGLTYPEQQTDIQRCLHAPNSPKISGITKYSSDLTRSKIKTPIEPQKNKCFPSYLSQLDIGLTLRSCGENSLKSHFYNSCLKRIVIKMRCFLKQSSIHQQQAWKPKPPTFSPSQPMVNTILTYDVTH